MVFADNAAVAFFPNGQLGIELLFPTYGGNDTVMVGSGTNLFFDQAGSVTYVFPAGVTGTDTVVEAAGNGCATQAARHDTFDFSGFAAPLSIDYSPTETRMTGGSSPTSPQLAVSVSNPGSIEQVITTSHDQVLLGFFDIDALTHGKVPAGVDRSHHDDDGALAAIVNAGAGDDLLTVSSAGRDDVAVTGGSTSPTPWSLHVEDPRLVVINTADAAAVVKTGCLRYGDSRNLVVNRGGAAMNPPPVPPDGGGSGCGDNSCDFGCLTFTVTGFGAAGMNLLDAVGPDCEWGWTWW